MTQHASILVVDDDGRLRDLLEKFLSSHGYLVTSCPSASDARDKLIRDPYALVILDIMMPLESGYSVLSWLRQQKAPLSETPVLILTALGEEEQRAHGLASGANDYVTKPFEPKELLERVTTLLAP